MAGAKNLKFLFLFFPIAIIAPLVNTTQHHHITTHCLSRCTMAGADDFCPPAAPPAVQQTVPEGGNRRGKPRKHDACNHKQHCRYCRRRTRNGDGADIKIFYADEVEEEKEWRFGSEEICCGEGGGGLEGGVGVNVRAVGVSRCTFGRRRWRMC